MHKGSLLHISGIRPPHHTTPRCSLTHSNAPVPIPLQPDAQGALWRAVARLSHVNGHVGNREAVALRGRMEAVCRLQRCWSRLAGAHPLGQLAEPLLPSQLASPAQALPAQAAASSTHLLNQDAVVGVHNAHVGDPAVLGGQQVDGVQPQLLVVPEVRGVGELRGGRVGKW